MRPVILAAFLFTSAPVAAESVTVVVFDASGSMWNRIEGDLSRIEVARDVVGQYFFSRDPEAPYAVVAYGHQRKGDCGDIEVVMPMGRLGEAVQVEWTDIDLKLGIIDNYNTKTRKQVLVPISDRLLRVLKRLHNQPRPFLSMDRAIKILRRVIRAECPSSARVRDEELCPKVGDGVIRRRLEVA